MDDVIAGWLTDIGVSGAVVAYVRLAAALVLLALLVGAASFVARRLLVPVLEKAVRKSSVHWDDTIAAHGFFTRLARLLPVLVIYLAADLMFADYDPAAEIIRRLALTLFVLAGIRILDALLDAGREIYEASELARQKPIGGYIEAVKIIVYILGIIFAIGVLTDKSPWGILSVLGGLTAVLILVFKDTILGFVASLQLSALDMVRVGDWIEMPKYGADGDVIAVSIHTVKVRNWDKTIVTVPTYALVSSSFKNWRGMSDSGGRRIKRAINIDMNSVKFCTAEMLARLGKINLLADYLADKEAEIGKFNADLPGVAPELPNGRRQTNIGIFRAYMVNYLRAHPKIHPDMTFLVRHLPPGPHGIPIEIYVFSNDQVWANYEGIQADIFDHIMAVLPVFELRVFQFPTGYDLRLGTTNEH